MRSPPPAGEKVEGAWESTTKVVDDKGNPLVVYHGSPITDITEFKGKSYGDIKTPSIHFAVNRSLAEGYTGKQGGRVYEARLDISNPKRMKGVVRVEDHIDAKAEGFDGAIVSDADGRIHEYVVYDPSQIKPAQPTPRSSSRGEGNCIPRHSPRPFQ